MIYLIVYPGAGKVFETTEPMELLQNLQRFDRLGRARVFQAQELNRADVEVLKLVGESNG